MVRTSSNAATADRTPPYVIKCLKSGDCKELAELVSSKGTDFLKSDKSIKVNEMDVSVVAYFCSKGNQSCVQKCLQLEPNSNLKSALYHSIIQASLPCVQMVMAAHKTQGHDPLMVCQLQPTGGLKAIIYAAQVGIDILREVCEHEAVGIGSFIMTASVTKDSFISKTPLDLVHSGDCVDYLCTRWNQDANNGISAGECDIPRPLHRAAGYAKLASIIERLVANGAHVDASTVNGTKIVGRAIHILSGNIDMPYNEMLRSMRALVEIGKTNPSAPSIMLKQTPLFIALKTKVRGCVDYLVVEAKVSAEEDDAIKALLAMDAEARSLLEQAKAMLAAGVTRVPDAVEVKRARVATDADLTTRWSEPIRAESCRFNAESLELTSNEWTLLPPPGVQEKARLVAKCLEGEALHSDGSYLWTPFWALPDPSKRSSRRQAKGDFLTGVLLHALGSEQEAVKAFKVTPTSTKVLLDHLGWDETSLCLSAVASPVNPLDIETLRNKLQTAKNLDRDERLDYLLQALGTVSFGARFVGSDKFVCGPVFIAAIDDLTESIYGCFATRVDT